jgi:hypothetical protein
MGKNLLRAWEDGTLDEESFEPIHPSPRASDTPETVTRKLSRKTVDLTRSRSRMVKEAVHEDDEDSSSSTQ